MSNEEEVRPSTDETARHRRARLTERDFRILLFLGEHGCVSGTRVKSYFWSSSEKSWAHTRRLRALAEQGLIEKVTGDRSMHLGYGLTKKGRLAVRERYPGSVVSVLRRSYQTQFEHDQKLIDVRKILEQSPLVKKFVAENELRAGAGSETKGFLNWQNKLLVPDGIFTFQTPKQSLRVALEIEMTQKSKRRYRRIFRSHLLSKEWNLAIYVVKTKSLQKSLMETLEAVKGNDLEVRLAKIVNGIYFCSLEEFLSKGLETPMRNGKKEFSFAEVGRKIGSDG